LSLHTSSAKVLSNEEISKIQIRKMSTTVARKDTPALANFSLGSARGTKQDVEPMSTFGDGFNM
jgi:hypothetical protein